MTEINIIPQLTFDNGRIIGRTNAAGPVTIQLKESVIERGYGLDAVVLGDQRGVSICGPLDMVAGLALARSVIEGVPRETTDPLSIYAISACLLALADDIAARRISSVPTSWDAAIRRSYSGNRPDALS